MTDRAKDDKKSAVYSTAAGLLLVESGPYKLFVACVIDPNGAVDMQAIIAGDMDSAIKAAEETTNLQVIGCVRVATCIRDIDRVLTAPDSKPVIYVNHEGPEL